MTRIFLIILALFCVTSCAHSGNPFDYEVAGERLQTVDVSGAREIIVKCYCPLHIVSEISGNSLTLRVKGSQSAVGYHGSGNPNNPTEVSKELLAFVERRNGDVLTLESRERTYIHHAALLSEVHVSAPAGLSVKVIEIPYQDLEAREVH